MKKFGWIILGGIAGLALLGGLWLGYSGVCGSSGWGGSSWGMMGRG